VKTPSVNLASMQAFDTRSRSNRRPFLD